jgi:2-amino-4-hydroxy-6-hydroxymethyldihydropteridine diphosphokinase
MAQVYVSIGSNSNRQQNIAMALAQLKKQFGKLVLSPIYESKPMDGRGGNYYNLALGLHTEMPPAELRNCLRQIENRLGRQRTSAGCNGGGEVSIDLDLLLYDQLTRQFADFQLPHPDLARYRHVLQPLADIAGNLSLPGTRQTLHSLLNDPRMVGSVLKTVTDHQQALS